jgi:hypothetical protein
MEACHHRGLSRVVGSVKTQSCRAAATRRRLVPYRSQDELPDIVLEDRAPSIVGEVSIADPFASFRHAAHDKKVEFKVQFDPGAVTDIRSGECIPRAPGQATYFFGLLRRESPARPAIAAHGAAQEPIKEIGLNR